MAAISLGFIVMVTPWTIQEIVTACTGSKASVLYKGLLCDRFVLRTTRRIHNEVTRGSSVLILWHLMFYVRPQLPPFLDFLVTWTALSNSLWNPFMYWLLNSDFRRMSRQLMPNKVSIGYPTVGRWISSSGANLLHLWSGAMFTVRFSSKSAISPDWLIRLSLFQTPRAHFHWPPRTPIPKPKYGYFAQVHPAARKFSSCTAQSLQKQELHPPESPHKSVTEGVSSRMLADWPGQSKQSTDAATTIAGPAKWFWIMKEQI